MGQKLIAENFNRDKWDFFSVIPIMVNNWGKVDQHSVHHYCYLIGSPIHLRKALSSKNLSVTRCKAVVSRILRISKNQLFNCEGWLESKSGRVTRKYFVYWDGREEWPNVYSYDILSLRYERPWRFKKDGESCRWEQRWSQMLKHNNHNCLVVSVAQRDPVLLEWMEE